MIGELGLDGRVRPVRGVLPAVLAAADAGYRAGRRAGVQPRPRRRWSPGVSVLGVRSLRQLIAVLTRRTGARRGDRDEPGRPDPMLAGLTRAGRGRGHRACAARAPRSTDHGHDLADVAGQTRRAHGAGGRRGRAATTCSSRGRRARARRCSPSGCPGCCRR